MTDTIRKAVIPIAGAGTRLAPLTHVVPKALFPLVDAQDRCRPVLHWIAAQAAAAGVTDLAIVLSPAQLPMVRAYLDSLGAAAGRSAKPSRLARVLTAAAPPLPRRIELLVQDRPAGFGDAVLQAQAFVGKERFLLLLGDHVYLPQGPSCPQQVAAAFARCGGAAMIGVQPVSADDLPRVGVAAGEPLAATNSKCPPPRAGATLAAGATLKRSEAKLGGVPPCDAPAVYRCRAFIEKPTLAQARRTLLTPGLPPGKYLAHCGIYAFTDEIFDCLRALAARSGRPQARSIDVPPQARSTAGRLQARSTVGGSRRAQSPAPAELELAAAQSLLLHRHGQDYYLCRIAGTALDTGTPATYARACETFHRGCSLVRGAIGEEGENND